MTTALGMTTALSTADELLGLQQTLYASRNPTRRWLHCTRRDWILDALRRHAPARAEQALEIGPGSGIYLAALADRFDHVVAADVEAAFLAQARRLALSRGNISAVADDIVASRLPEAAFDLILCSEVIEHIRDSATALANMHRALKPGGVLILSTPQRYSLMELTCKIAFLPGIIHLVRKIYREPVLETGHINLMTSATVRAQLKTAGFAVRESAVGGLYLPGIAEFLGGFGLAIETATEKTLKRLGIVAPLWTQYYVAVRAG